MYFEGRELKSLPRPVKKNELKLNNVYFALKYQDKGMLVPSLEPVVFIGNDLDPTHKGELYFQDFVSHQKGISFSSSSPDDASEFFIIPEKTIGFIFEYDAALNELLKCSIKREESSGRN
jgi:hypothetical protein